MSTGKHFDTELFFSALADRTRLRLLNLLREGEVCVCFFAGALGTNNPKISRHLSYLKKAALVTARRDGKWMHYSIQAPGEPHARELFQATMNLLAADPQMAQDRQRLAEFCCAPNAPTTIKGRARPPDKLS